MESKEITLDDLLDLEKNSINQLNEQIEVLTVDKIIIFLNDETLKNRSYNLFNLLIEN